MSEGYVEWEDHRTWYLVVGNIHATLPPLVICHGGPGIKLNEESAVTDVRRVSLVVAVAGLQGLHLTANTSCILTPGRGDVPVPKR